MAAGSPTDLRLPALAGGVLIALACGHSEPFTTPPYGTDQPFDPSPPARLTLNEASDRGPSWLPDGSGILYSAAQSGRADADVCLALLPAGGGSQQQLVCDLSPRGGDSTNAIESAVVSSGGRLAFVKHGSTIGAVGPTHEAITVGSLSDVAGAAEIQPVPYTISGEARHQVLTVLRWAGDERLAFVGGAVRYGPPCQFCPPDTLATGLKVALLDLSAATPAPVAVPATDYASGVSGGATADEIYYTLGGDSRVFRRVLSSGAVEVVHDFGAAGIARDVHVAGSRLVAVVGGRVAFGVHADLGPTQWDSGGVIHVLDLGAGGEVALEGPGLFRRPALAPAGDRVVAEGYPLIITPTIDPVTGGPGPPDTTVARAGDLYLFETP
jgi:hypothetical protein